MGVGHSPEGLLEGPGAFESSAFWEEKPCLIYAFVVGNPYGDQFSVDGTSFFEGMFIIFERDHKNRFNKRCWAMHTTLQHPQVVTLCATPSSCLLLLLISFILSVAEAAHPHSQLTALPPCEASDCELLCCCCCRCC